MNKNFDTLVLPGGGIKGFYILGAVQAAMDSGLLQNIDTYIATSVGSLISYLLAIGYTPIEIMVNLYTNKWMEKMQFIDLVSMVNGTGAVNFDIINSVLEKLTINKIGKLLTLGELKTEYKKNLICTTYNMSSCENEYLNPDDNKDLPCLTALRMSSNIPLIFGRFKYNNCYYIDGGIVDNFPILKGDQIGKKILGINLEIEEKSLRDDPEDGIITYFLRLLQVPVLHANKERLKLASNKCFIISINTGDMRSMIEFDVKSKIRLDMFSCGYGKVKESIINN